MRDIQTGTATRDQVAQITAAFEKGRGLLDKHIPNWREAFKRVPKEAFAFSDARFCVLGTLGNKIADRTLRIPTDLPPITTDAELGYKGWNLMKELLGTFLGRKGVLAYFYPGAYGFDAVPGICPYMERYEQYPILQQLWEREIWG